MHIATINEKESMNLKRARRDIWKGAEGRKGRGRDVIMISKTGEIHRKIEGEDHHTAAL